MAIRAIGWLLASMLLWRASSASAQGVLGALGRLAVDGAALDDPRAPLARRATLARALGHLGDETAAVSVLTTALARRPAHAVRDAVVMSLAERRSARAVPELLRALRVRVGGESLIFHALAAIGGASVIEAFTELAQGADPSQRDLALWALARTAPSSAASLLLPAMSGTDAMLRVSAFRIATEEPNALWADRLAQALNDGSAPIEPAIIVWSLSRVSRGGGLRALLSVASHSRRVSRSIPRYCSAAIVACVRAYRPFIDPELVERAELLLRGEPSAVPALEWLVQASVEPPRAAGNEGGDHTAARVELRAELRTVGTDTGPTRSAAAIALARLADAKAHVPLIAALSDPEVAVRRAVVRALVLLDRDEARAALLRFVATEPDSEVARLAAAGARGEWDAVEDPWQKARDLSLTAVDPPVDRAAPPLAR